MKKNSLTKLSLSILTAFIPLCVFASNNITAIELQGSDPDNQTLAITFDQPPSEPSSFSISNPPRIAYDFKETRNQTGKTQLQFANSQLQSATIVESVDRARLILNLSKSIAHKATISNNQLLINLGNPARPEATIANSKILAPIEKASPSVIQASTPAGGMIRNVEFRRGAKGEARIVIDTPSDSTPSEIKREGNNLVVNLSGVNLPRHLERRLDVTDFATPASRVDATNQGSNSLITIQSAGNWEFSSYQTNKQLVIEVRTITDQEAEANLQAQGKSSYKGERLSLNFQTVEVRSLLQVIAEFTGLNIITSDSVSGTLTLRLTDVPWDQALDLILEQKNLEKRAVGNVIRIAPRNEIIEIEKQAAEARKQKVNAEPVITETMTIKYRAAEEIKAAIQDLTRRVTERTTSGDTTTYNSNDSAILVDSRSNRLIIRERVSVLEEIRRVIEILDVPLRQVLIEARIVEAKDNFQRDLGVKLGLTKVGGDTAIGNWSKIPIPGTGSVLGSEFAQPFNPNVNLPASLGGGAIGAIFKNTSTLIGLELSAMQAEDQGKIVSSPRILTADRTKAMITEGTEIPYQSLDENGKASTTFKKANLSLAVTPQVTPEDDIIMDLDISKDTLNTKLTLSAGPAIDNKTVKTQVRVENGGTVVIGGIYVQDQNNVENKIPLLGDIPVLGHLFRNKSVSNNRRELLIFITPRIVENELIGR